MKNPKARLNNLNISPSHKSSDSKLRFASAKAKNQTFYGSYQSKLGSMMSTQMSGGFGNTPTYSRSRPPRLPGIHGSVNKQQSMIMNDRQNVDPIQLKLLKEQLRLESRPKKLKKQWIKSNNCSPEMRDLIMKNKKELYELLVKKNSQLTTATVASSYLSPKLPPSKSNLFISKPTFGTKKLSNRTAYISQPHQHKES